MFTHVVIRSYRDSSGAIIQSTENVQADTELNVDCPVLHTATDMEIDYAAIRTRLKSLMIQSDVALTIDTNSTGSPGDTITLTAGQEIVWSLAADSLASCPFSVDVTKIYVTGAGGSTPDGTLKIRSLSDQTP